MKNILFFFLFALFANNAAIADVVKPALVEIHVTNEKQIVIEIRASLEALLTGINAQYKNTTEAPNADEYDEFRQMSAADLGHAFDGFKQQFIDQISIKAGAKALPLSIEKIEIPPPGYTKVPRISVVYVKASLPNSAASLVWYYPEKFGDNAVRVKQVDSQNEQWHWSQWQWLRNDAESTAFSLTEIVARQSVSQVVWLYIKIGFEHIVPKGLDHLLFILGLFLLSTRLRPLFWQITMFTVAHTITLGLAMNNVVELPPRIVEPLIALSIAYIAVENLLTKNLHSRRLVLVFAFGLLHGLGFAGVLSDFGMPEGDFVTALISFNIGVELGQIVTVIVAYLFAKLLSPNKESFRRFIVVPGSIVIAAIGVFWFFERLEFI